MKNQLNLFLSAENSIRVCYLFLKQFPFLTVDDRKNFTPSYLFIFQFIQQGQYILVVHQKILILKISFLNNAVNMRIINYFYVTNEITSLEARNVGDKVFYIRYFMIDM